jgi:phosphate transport system substrate-binding protein
MRINRWRAAGFAALFFLSGPAALAQDVALTSRDGSLSLSGTLQGFDGAFYRIETQFGLLTVDAEGVVCDGPACPDLLSPKAIIRIVGEGRAGQALLPPLLAAYASARGAIYVPSTEPDAPAFLFDRATNAVLAEISFSPMTGDGAEAAIATGRADLMLGAATEAGFGTREIALDALVPITAPGNPIPFVTTPDLARALSGEIKNWNEIGGPDMPLVLHGLAPESDLARALAARLGRAEAASMLHADMDALALAVARDPWALAVTGRTGAAPARVLALRDSCGFPLLPDAMSVKSEDYPLSMPMFFQIPRRHIGLVLRDFLEFLSTPAAETAIASSGYVDRAVTSQPLTDDGLRLINAINGAEADTGLDDLRRLTALMDGRARLSLTFRFEGGSSTLDAHSRDGLADLALLLESGAFAGQELALVGFSDGSGAAAANLDLSQARAEAVLSALRLLAPTLTDARLPRVEALGELLPIACDETGAGRRLNRRVELWSKPQLMPDSPVSEN